MTANLECTRHLGEYYPSPAIFCHLACTVIEALNIILPFYQASCFRMMDPENGRISEFHEHRPIVILHLLLNELLDKKQCCGIPQWWTRHSLVHGSFGIKFAWR